MKKMMMFVAAAVCASALHAATMSWSVMNMQAADVKEGWVVALYDAATAFDAEAAKAGKLSPAYTGTTQASGTTSVKAGQSGLNRPDGKAYEPLEEVGYYAVIFNSSDISSATSFLKSETVTKTVASNGANFSVSFGSMSASTTANAFKNAMAAGWSNMPGSDVPEPTSGLLLIVGGAMLALRRKQK